MPKQKTVEWNLSVDPILLFLSAVSFSTRFYKLDQPRAVVFDELHYVKFISLYLKRTFFFDPQPPLGKQLISLVAWLASYQGDLHYTHIGEIYDTKTPVFTLRFLPCFCGSLIAPLVYLIGLELGLRQTSASFAAALIISENSLLTQSKFLLLDPILILFILLSIYSYLRFRQTDDSQLSSFVWLNLTTVLSTCAMLTKFSGLYSVLLITLILSADYWSKLISNQYSSRNLTSRFVKYIIAIAVVPSILYISVYYTHLRWLNKAGPHDNILSSAFQASLEGGLASITRGQPLEIVHGSQITLRHTHGRSCWLHSHEHLYPIRYPDGRGSSHQQQVTCYSFKDVNNWWIVKRPLVDDLAVTEPLDKIMNGDLIQLIHGLTGRPLNSHDVASAMSAHSQEVSCYVDHNISMPAQDLWRVDLINGEFTGNHWHTINSRLRLIHFNSSKALKYSGFQLPDWGFHQHEIVSDRDIMHQDTVWNVEEHKYTKSRDQRERENELGSAEFVPLEPTSLSFWDKFLELHVKMFSFTQDASKDHLYACESPFDWILLSKGTAYWIDLSHQTNNQIFLTGNMVTWYAGNISIVLYCLLQAFHCLRRRRKIYDLNDDVWCQFSSVSLILISAYLMHLIPYAAYETTLFLHDYLPALVFKILILTATVDHFNQYSPRLCLCVQAVILCAVFSYFNRFLSLSYGTGNLSGNEIANLRIKDTWQLITVVP
ncbi:Protein O-mannosyltransferase 1, partial [Fragariocoptes setiger]